MQFEWRKDPGDQLLAPFGPKTSDSGHAEKSGGEELKRERIHISRMDDSASVLRISQLEAEDSGNYTCLARNQLGHDASTVRVNVNGKCGHSTDPMDCHQSLSFFIQLPRPTLTSTVRLKWVKEPPSELQVRAAKSVQLECDASGQPTPIISWTSLKGESSLDNNGSSLPNSFGSNISSLATRIAAFT